jgi:hypothetical protein
VSGAARAAGEAKVDRSSIHYTTRTARGQRATLKARPHGISFPISLLWAARGPPAAGTSHTTGHGRTPVAGAHTAGLRARISPSVLWYRDKRDKIVGFHDYTTRDATQSITRKRGYKSWAKSRACGRMLRCDGHFFRVGPVR